jgi:hypothetical protein
VRECGWDFALGRSLAPDSEFDLEARRADGWAIARALKKGLDLVIARVSQKERRLATDWETVKVRG